MDVDVRSVRSSNDIYDPIGQVGWWHCMSRKIVDEGGHPTCNRLPMADLEKYLFFPQINFLLSHQGCEIPRTDHARCPSFNQQRGKVDHETWTELQF
jgi:hypothetical protein